MALKLHDKLFEEFANDPQKVVAILQDPEQGAQRLREIVIFSRFHDDELRQIYTLGKIEVIKPRCNAVVEGEPTRGMFILIHGRVSVYKTDPATNSMVRLAILEDGANFGELSLFDDAPRSATVVAETFCYLFLLEAAAFEQYLENSADEVRARFFRTCAEELAARFRNLNIDYLNSQRLLWKHALRRSEGSNRSS